jgi:energy-coupling factor transporter ATP-binding protein EcfA2
MRLRGLVFERFGPFERAEVDLCDASGTPLDVALIVGPTGSGKSLLLRGVAGVLAEAAGGPDEIDEDLVRRTANSARCRVVFDDRIEGERVVVTVEKEIPGHGIKSAALDRWRNAVAGEARAACSVDDDAKRDEEDDEPFAWLCSIARSGESDEWAAAKKTLDYLLRPHRVLRVDPKDLVFDTGAGFASSRELGAGFASLLVMTLELLRLSLESAGELVYLVDDIDAHLHPRAASKLLGDLGRAFPRVQLVASTHSPFVVASVEPSQVFRIQGPKSIVRVSDRISESASSSSVMEVAFGAPDLGGPRWAHVPPLDVRRQVLALVDRAKSAVWVLPELVHARDVRNAFGEGVLGGQNGRGHIFFVDLAPGEPWGHACEYVFRACDGNVVRAGGEWPPVDLARFIPLAP